MTQWCDDDALWTAYLRFGELEARRGSAAQEVEQLEALLQIRPGSEILDMCCGVGRHSIELARRGYRLTGVDRFEPFLAKARAAAKAGGVGTEVEWVRDDMRTFSRPRAFEAAVSLFTSFGYFHDDTEERRVLENLFVSLKPGGRLVMDVMGKEVIARIFRSSMVTRRVVAGGEAILIDEPRVGDDWRHIASRWTFVWPEGGRESFEIKCRCYAATELKRQLADAGFTDVQAFGGLDGCPYDENAQRLVIAARRPT